MRLYVSSRGRVGVSFGAIGCLVYAAGACIVAIAAALAYLLYGVTLGVAWLVRHGVTAWRERKGELPRLV